MTRLRLGLLLLTAGGALLFYVQYQGARLDALQAQLQDAANRQAAAEVRAAVSEAEVDRLAEQRRQEAANRSEYLSQLQGARDEIAGLERDLRDSRYRLSVGAECSGGAGVSGPGSAGGAEAPTAELSASARRAYLDLRERIAEVEAWVALCHSTVAGWSEG